MFWLDRRLDRTCPGDGKVQKTDFVSAIFWLIFAGLVCTLSYRLQLGTLREPGPGFLFFFCGLALGIMSLVMLFSSLRKRGAWTPLALLFKGLNVGKMIFVVLSLFFYVAILEALGFILTTFLLFIFLLKGIERKGWRLSLLTSAVVTVCCYLLFEFWLETQLPQGLLALIHY
ncbi:MAG: tripartite tricarboxylate transporter TctB family protein [Deltaproteobacteria bacterium]|nr:tripartite tricarboxylate transporter TctB family protein [Deltaproteobacteria bacterium]